MAKKKQSEPKDMPRRGEVWEKTDADPVPVYHLEAFYQRGKERGFTCRIVTEDKAGNLKETREDVPLIAFGSPAMKMIDDRDAQEEPEVAQPVVMVKPIKDGVALMCPGQDCGDKHEIVMQVTSFEEYIKQLREAHTKFVARHDPHMRDGTLFGAQS